MSDLMTLVTVLSHDSAAEGNGSEYLKKNIWNAMLLSSEILVLAAGVQTRPHKTLSP